MWLYLIDCHKKHWLLLWVLMWSCDGASLWKQQNKQRWHCTVKWFRWVSLPRLPLSVYQPIRVLQVSSSSYQNPLNSCSHTFHLVCLKPNGPPSCFYSADGRTFDLTHSLSAWRKQQQRYCLSSWEFLN